MISQKEIARLTELSPSLVSRVLSGKAEEIGVSQETVDKVMEIATKNGYIPSKFATGLKKGKTHLIGVIVQSFEDVYLIKILEVLKREASKQGLSILLTGFEEDHYNEEELINLLSYQPEATLVIGTTDFSTWPEHIVSKLPKLLCIGQPTKHPNVTYISTNEKVGAELVVKAIREKDVKNLAIVSDGSVMHQRRLELVKPMLKKGKVKVVLEEVGIGEGFQVGEKAADKIIKDISKIDAVYCLDDYVALGLIRSLLKNDIKIPHDIRICGFDDIPFSKMLYPALTTVTQPIDALVTSALNLIQEQKFKPSVLELDPELVERETF